MSPLGNLLDDVVQQTLGLGTAVYPESVGIEISPDTGGMTPNGLPIQAADRIDDSQGGLDNDGVSRAAPPDPTATLIALAAPGRNPADITIPVLAGGEASGGGGSHEAPLGSLVSTVIGLGSVFLLGGTPDYRGPYVEATPEWPTGAGVACSSHQATSSAEPVCSDRRRRRQHRLYERNGQRVS